MQHVIVNAVAAGEVEGVVVVSTEAANRLNGFGGWCGGERPATARDTWAVESARTKRSTQRRELRRANQSRCAGP